MNCVYGFQFARNVFKIVILLKLCLEVFIFAWTVYKDSSFAGNCIQNRHFAWDCHYAFTMFKIVILLELCFKIVIWSTFCCIRLFWL